MSSQEPRIRVKRADGVIHVEFVDRNILDEGNIQAIGEQVAALVDSEQVEEIYATDDQIQRLLRGALGG